MGRAMKAAGKRGSGGQGGKAGPLHLHLDFTAGEGKRKGTAGKLTWGWGGGRLQAQPQGGEASGESQRCRSDNLQP